MVGQIDVQKACGGLQGRGLAPIHLANDAGASTAAQSGEMKGEAPPLLYTAFAGNLSSIVEATLGRPPHAFCTSIIVLSSAPINAFA